MVKEKGSCRLAVKHYQCKPGEYIQQKGIDVHIFCGNINKVCAQIIGKYSSQVTCILE